jgi:hypothetical protein
VNELAWIASCLAAPLVVVAIGAAVAARIEMARERRRHARVLEGLGAPVPGPELVGIVARSVVTLEGKLVSGDAATAAPLVSFHPYGTSFLDEPNVYAITHVPAHTPCAVELDGGGRALREGSIQVLAGSVESEHGAPLEQASVFEADELARAKVRTRVGQFRSARAGDRVRVRGAVEPAPDDDALYRARSNVLRMSPGADDSSGARTSITVAVSEPPVRKRIGPRRTRTIAFGSGLIIGGAAAFFFTARHAPVTHGTSSVADGGASAPAPACRAAVLGKVQTNKATDAADDAKACDDPYAKAVVHYANGDFREASAAFADAATRDPDLVPSVSEAETHLFAHDYAHAASAVHRMIARFYPGPSTAEKRYLECIAGVLDDRTQQANDAGVGPYYVTAPGKRYRKICSTRPFAKFARELDAEGAYWGDDDWRDFANHEYLHDANYDVIGNPFSAALALRSRMFARPIGVEKDLLDRLLVASGPGRLDRPRGRYGRLNVFFGHEEDFYPPVAAYAAELTLFYAYAGFPERSKPYWPILDLVAETLEASPARSFHVVESTFEYEKKLVEAERDVMTFTIGLALASALLSGDDARVKRYAAVGEVHAAHVYTQLQTMLRPGAAWEEPAEDGHWPEHSALFAAAGSGDAANVVKLLTEQRSTGRDTLARILPRISRNRAALDTWLKDAYPAPCVTCGATDFFGHLSDRREVTRLLGHTQESDALRPAAARFTDALTDTSIAFELDELETFFGRKR